MRQKAAIGKFACQARQKRPLIVTFDSSTRKFNKLAVLNPGRARSFARAAIQTFVDMFDEAGIYRSVALLDANHLVNSSARGICLQMPESVRRAIVQTQSTMHTARVVFIDCLQPGNVANCAHEIRCLQESGRWRMFRSGRRLFSRGVEDLPIRSLALCNRTRISTL